MEGGLKSGNFIFRGILITAISQFPTYLEWAKAKNNFTTEHQGTVASGSNNNVKNKIHC